MRQTRMKSVFLTIALLSTAMLETSCTTMADAQAAKGTGMVSVYNQSYDTMWTATLDSLYAVHNYRNSPFGDIGPHFKIITADKMNGLILAKGSGDSFSVGENVAIYVSDLGDHKTQVEIISKRVITGNYLAHNWDVELTNSLEQRFFPVSTKAAHSH